MKAPVTKLTTKFEADVIIAFNVAVDVLDARSGSHLIHDFVRSKIREAKGQVGEEKFQELYAEKERAFQERSIKKAKESKRARTTRMTQHSAKRGAKKSSKKTGTKDE